MQPIRICNKQLQQQEPNLFAELPFHPEPPSDDVRLRPFATINFIPGVSHRLKRAFQKAGCNLFHRGGQKLQNILCGKNKSRPLRVNARAFTNSCVAATKRPSTLVRRGDRSTNAQTNIARPSKTASGRTRDSLSTRRSARPRCLGLP